MGARKPKKEQRRGEEYRVGEGRGVILRKREEVVGHRKEESKKEEYCKCKGQTVRTVERLWRGYGVG